MTRPSTSACTNPINVAPLGASPTRTARARWALFEAAQSATRLQGPDYADYHALKSYTPKLWMPLRRKAAYLPG
jgi:hypothetical protein